MAGSQKLQRLISHITRTVPLDSEQLKFQNHVLQSSVNLIFNANVKLTVLLDFFQLVKCSHVSPISTANCVCLPRTKINLEENSF